MNPVTSAVPPAPAAPENVDPAAYNGEAYNGEAYNGEAYPPAGAPGGPYGPYQVYYSEPDKVTAFFGKVNRRTPKWIAPVVLAGCCAAASAYVLWSNPTDGGAGDMPSCLVRLTTGFDCPGCGGTRAAWYLLHGDVAAAARHHIVFVFAVPFLIYFYVAWAVQTAFGKKLPQLRVGPVTVGAFFGAWLLFSVLRNLPWAPFTWFYV